MIDPDDASILLTTSHGRTADEPLEPEADDSLVGDGEIWGDFRIGRMLGRGGMGTVYLAHQLSMDRDVALKVLPPRLGDSEDFKRRFQLEAQVVGRISSPHVVQIHAAGVHLDHHWFAMEYVDGCDLASRLYHAQRPTALEAIDLVAQAARGLVVAAEHDVVHRDIKPGNLMISAKGVVKLMDFGLLRIAREDISATVTGVVMGTVGYLSPEQARGERCDQRTDIYSLGVVLYELLTGQLPFNGEASVVIHHHIHTAPTRPREIDPTIPPHLEAVVLTCLAKHPDERYPSAAHLLSDLEALQEDREPALALALRRRSWHWWLVTALLASLLAVFIAIAARPTPVIGPTGSSPAASDVAAANGRSPVEPPCAPETVAASAVTCVCGSAIAVPAPFIGGDVTSYSWSIEGERGRCGWLDSRDSAAPKTTWTAPGRAGASTLHVVAHDRRGVSHEATVPLIAVAAAADAPRSLQVFLRRDWSFPAMTRLVEHPLGGWWAIESDHLLHVDARFSNPARIPLTDDAAGRHPIAVRSWHGDLYVLTASQVMVFAADGSCTRTLLSS
ncbi:MAG: serine/threonine protein kinase [Planctomycetes bacterium]|nr:serine/threonine protein kinase [Planctomycetota bacterium]